MRRRHLTTGTDSRSAPGSGSDSGDESERDPIECPFCGSADTRLERKRGPGLCRTVHYCESCEQPFEEFS